MKIGRISIVWHAKKASSPESTWQLDDTPSGEEELRGFGNPSELLDGNRKALENRDFANDIQQKGKFARTASRVTWGWLFVLGYVIIAQGHHFYGFKLRPEEFIAVVTTTTASVFGFSFIVGRYLFGRRNGVVPQGPTE